MKLNSLRFKAIISYSISVIILLGFYSWALHGTARVTEDEIINNILKHEADAYFKKYSENENTAFPSIENLKVFDAPGKLPESFAETLPVLSDGIYETTGPAEINGPEGHNILIRTYPDSTKRIYMIYNANPVIKAKTCDLGSGSILLIIFILTAAIGILLTAVIGKIIFRPLDSLTGKLSEYSPEDLERSFPEAERNDEIGLLASNIQNSFSRLHNFANREQEFTRDTSHELRTPLSVIKGAVELLQLSEASKKPEISKPLKRIERSTKDMEGTIQTLLWLAREENRKFKQESFAPAKAVGEVVRSLYPLADRKNITLELELNESPLNNAPEQVFRIVLSNIINNAFNFTPGGSVGILLSGSTVTIRDTGSGIPEGLINKISMPYIKGKNSSGFGLGLSIVKRLCNHFAWKISIRKREEGGTAVSIDISSTAMPQTDS